MVEFLATGQVKSRLPWKDQSMRTISGTSFSAPLVTGMMARILSVNPGVHPDQMKMMLRGYAGSSNPAVV
jgi:hypothetical protein